MIWTENWLAAVIQLFDHTLRVLLGEAFFSVLIDMLLLLIAFSLIASMLRTGKKI